MGEQSIDRVHNGFSNEDHRDSEEDGDTDEQEENTTEGIQCISH